MMAGNECYHQTFDGQTEQLGAIREFVGQAVEALGGVPDDVFACQLSADEAAVNAYMHGYAGEPGRVEIWLWCEADTLILRLREWGAPFNPDDVPPPDLKIPPTERRLGGAGLFLMRKLMDEVHFESDPEEGKTLTLKRRLRQASPDDQ
jgi:anti-sigma regulatory factor (Ser/Thr protein kinase)